jgi:hypothetical protein
MRALPPTGTAALLEILSAYIPDAFINSLFIRSSGAGRRRLFSFAQLFRVSLLPLLTPAHSFNLVVRLLGEQRALRSFAYLRNRHRLPDVRMLHEFRDRLDLAKLRSLNKHLLQPLLDGADRFPKSVALIDSTDLPAATSAFKKKLRPVHSPPRQCGRAQPQRRSKPLLHRLQKTHAAALASSARFFGFTSSVDLVDCSGQSGRFSVFGAEHSLLRATPGLDSRHCCRRYGLRRPQSPTAPARKVEGRPCHQDQAEYGVARRVRRPLDDDLPARAGSPMDGIMRARTTALVWSHRSRSPLRPMLATQLLPRPVLLSSGGA